MAKTKTQYACTDCGAVFPKWTGQCSDCGQWNTLTEQLPAAANTRSARHSGYAGKTGAIQTMADVELQEVPRTSTQLQELDRVLGGGLVPGSVILIGGDPGIGKSTILLQAMCVLSQRLEALYVTGEESLQQVTMRAKRLGLNGD